MSSFLLLQDSQRDPYFQLAWEEALALEMPDFGIRFGVRIWYNQKTIVLGISEDQSKTVHPESIELFHRTYSSYKNFRNFRKFSRSRADFLFLARRASGGGTVYQNYPENLNFSLFLDITNRRDLYPIPRSYQILLGVVADTCKMMGYDVVPAGKSDLSIPIFHSASDQKIPENKATLPTEPYRGETSHKNILYDPETPKTPEQILRKISGNSQFRKKNILVQHGTLILQNKIISQIETHLLHPPEEPEYRKKRSHRDFLAAIPGTIQAEEFGRNLYYRLAKEYGDSIQEEKNPRDFLKASLRRARELKEKKYSSLDWILK